MAKKNDETVFKARSMSDARSFIEKKFGKESLIDESTKIVIPRQTTGFRCFDSKSGGGIPVGRVIELFGEEGSGKTTFASQVCKQFQKRKTKNLVLYMDFENALDMQYMKMLGVSLDPKVWMLSQPEDLETGIDIMRHLMLTGEIGCIIVDSIASMVPHDELHGEMSQNSMGLQARAMGKAFRKMVHDMNATKTTVIFINQMRAKIGGFGNVNLETPGGKALKFYASMRIWVTTGKSNWFDDGKHSKFRIIKNKTSFMQNQIAELEMIPGKGFSPEFEIFQELLEAKIIKEDGRSYKIGNAKMSLNDILAMLEDTKKRDSLVKLLDEKIAKAEKEPKKEKKSKKEREAEEKEDKDDEE